MVVRWKLERLLEGERAAAYKGAPRACVCACLANGPPRDACHVQRARVLLIAFNKRVARTRAGVMGYKGGQGEGGTVTVLAPLVAATQALLEGGRHRFDSFVW